MEYIHYPELLEECHLGKDEVLLEKDINLLRNTPFHDSGYGVVELEHNFLQDLVRSEIYRITGKSFQLEQYHTHITDEEHTKILNSMPYKITQNNLSELGKELESVVSTQLGEPVKIFNGDIWVRICRPSSLFSNDFNPCHRDIYLDFYRNTVNIYVPICGSNELSSLTIQPGSHLWNENETFITKGGSYFKSTGKKYSVDAIVASKRPLNMIRPNPGKNQILLFSPYLIHGCANNDNVNVTRISLEVRFIHDDSFGLQQEETFRDFLKMRTWR